MCLSFFFFFPPRQGHYLQWFVKLAHSWRKIRSWESWYQEFSQIESLQCPIFPPSLPPISFWTNIVCRKYTWVGIRIHHMITVLVIQLGYFSVPILQRDWIYHEWRRTHEIFESHPQTCVFFLHTLISTRDSVFLSHLDRTSRCLFSKIIRESYGIKLDHWTDSFPVSIRSKITGLHQQLSSLDSTLIDFSNYLRRVLLIILSIYYYWPYYSISQNRFLEFPTSENSPSVSYLRPWRIQIYRLRSKVPLTELVILI